MSASKNKPTGVFSDFEKVAMEQRAKELKAEAKVTKKREQGKLPFRKQSLPCQSHIVP